MTIKNSGNFMFLPDLFSLMLSPMRWLQWWALSILLAINTWAAADQIVVKTDRQKVEMGDIITLMVEADFQTRGAQLNTELLQDQFEILNQQQSNQIEIINGNYRSFTRWRLQLLPKHEGKLRIPPFEINGVRSQPYEIEVVKASYQDGNRPYFLEATVDKTEVRVQEQVIYSLRFFHKGSLINGNIRPPEFNGALNEPIKEQSVYGKTIQGQTYTVYEWQYALFPQRSGELEITGPSFSGLLQFQGRQKGVRAVADDIKINVKPIIDTKDNGQEFWLPAQSVSLSQQWQALPQTVHVGDSLQRSITLEVVGLTPSQLPEITTENGDNFKVYTDANQLDQTVNENGVTSIKLVSQAIVPTQPGKLNLPDITLKWWNTQTQQFETTVSSTPPITVWAGDASVPPVTQGPDNNTVLKLEGEAPSSARTQAVTGTESISRWWPMITVLMAFMWVITGLFLIHSRRQLQRLETAINAGDSNPVMPAVKTPPASWCELPLKAFYDQLLQQLRQQYGINSIENIQDPAFKAAVHELESHLFAEQPLTGDPKRTICDLWSTLAPAQKNKTARKSRKTHLAELYPSQPSS